MTPTHSDIVLRDELLVRAGPTSERLGRRVGAPIQRIAEVVNGKRDVTPGTTPRFWARLQMARDLAKHRPERRSSLPVLRHEATSTDVARRERALATW